MEGAVGRSADSGVGPHAEDVPPARPTLALPPRGVRPLVDQRPLERTVLDALSRRKSASRPPLMPVIIERMRVNFGLDNLSSDPRCWPYDRTELAQLMREISFFGCA